MINNFELRFGTWEVNNNIQISKKNKKKIKISKAWSAWYFDAAKVEVNFLENYAAISYIFAFAMMFYQKQNNKR